MPFTLAEHKGAQLNCIRYFIQILLFFYGIGLQTTHVQLYTHNTRRGTTTLPALWELRIKKLGFYGRAEELDRRYLHLYRETQRVH